MARMPRLKPKVIITAVVVGLIAILIAIWSWRAAEERRREEEIATAQGIARVLNATFSKRSRLEVGEISGTLDVTSVNSEWIFDSSQTAKLPFTVDYTVDLSRLSADDYRWNADSRTLMVEIPGVAAGSPNIDETRRVVLDTDGLWISRRASENLSRRAAVLAQRAAAKEAGKPVHIAKARDNAREAVATLIEAPLDVAGLGDVEVVVRFAGDGSRDGERWDVTPSLEEVLGNRS